MSSIPSGRPSSDGSPRPIDSFLDVFDPFELRDFELSRDCDCTGLLRPLKTSEKEGV
jgi:hypothetical protein